MLLYCYGMHPYRNVVRPEETETEPKWERKRIELLQGTQYHDAMSFRPKIQKTLLQKFLGGEKNHEIF